MIKGHGGNFRELAEELCCNPNEIFDMSSNLNPNGPPLGLLTTLKNNLNLITSLPDIDSSEICKLFAKKHQISSSMVLAGNGTTQLIYLLPKALQTKKALILAPTYADYTDACIINNSTYKYLITEEKSNFNLDFIRFTNAVIGCDTVFICNPNNPTGVLIPLSIIKKIVTTFPEKYFIIDESYLPFVNDKDYQSLIGSDFPNVIILSSMSKIFKIPGLRTGFLTASETVIKKCLNFFLPWSVNALAQVAVEYLLSNSSETDIFIKETKLFIKKERELFISEFKDQVLLKIYPSTTCFLLVKLLKSSFTAQDVCKKLAKEKILIRNCANFYGLSDSFIRFSLQSDVINSIFRKKLSAILRNEVLC